MNQNKGQKRSLSDDDEEEEIPRPSFGGGNLMNGQLGTNAQVVYPGSRSASSKRKHEENLSDDSDEPTSSTSPRRKTTPYSTSNLAAEFTAAARSLDSTTNLENDRATASSFSAAKLMVNLKENL